MHCIQDANVYQHVDGQIRETEGDTDRQIKNPRVFACVLSTRALVHTHTRESDTSYIHTYTRICIYIYIYVCASSRVLYTCVQRLDRTWMFVRARESVVVIWYRVAG